MSSRGSGTLKWETSQVKRTSGRWGAACLGSMLAVSLVACASGNGPTSFGPSPVVEETSDLVVTPDDPLISSGTQGGPFSPSSRAYSLTNSGVDSVSWTAVASQTWFTVSSGGGSLETGEQVNLTVSINASVAAGLGLGTHVGVATIRDTTAGVDITRPVSLNVSASGGSGSMASSLTQFGITWTFSVAHEVGQFANGDWWVVGPVTITSITPKSSSGGRAMNGSMINPSPRLGLQQGYDSTMYAQYKYAGSYSSEVNVALDVSASRPLTVQPHSSLVSTISESTPDVRPQIRTCAVLSILSAAAPSGSFRPSYSGSNKAIRFNESQLDYGLLAKLPIRGGVTSIEEAERMFERPWLDHVGTWGGRYTHPSQNMPDYGREMVDNVSVAALMLNLNYTDSAKRTLLVRAVQHGIDLFGIVQDGGERNWESAAGHMSGRKWPILFAGVMLADVAMSNIGFDPNVRFGEDGQTFYVAITSTGPTVINNGYGGYTLAQVGMPEWGTSHDRLPQNDDADWEGDPYRQCCTATTWWGQLLAAYAMGIKTLWNHDALFDYQDRYLTEMRARGKSGFALSFRPAMLTLWDQYRPNY